MSKRTNLASQVIMSAKETGKTIATAESCTAGWIAKSLTDPAGSSPVLIGGLVTYSNQAKTDLLGVSEAALKHGAVSEAVALEMADGARERLQTDLAIAVTGIAGPTGASASKPIGTVWIALSQKGKPTRPMLQEFGNIGRDGVRKAAVIYALEWLAEALKS